MARSAVMGVMLEGEDPYAVLGVPHGAALKDIRAAYRDGAKRLHPDSGAEPDAERFRRLASAYEVLRDPQRRLAYDEEARLGSLGGRLRWGSSFRTTAILGIAAAVGVVSGLAWALRDGPIATPLAATARFFGSAVAPSDCQGDGDCRGLAGSVAENVGSLLRAEVDFPSDDVLMDERLTRSLSAIARGLRDRSGVLPQDRGWVVLVMARTPHVVGPRGVLVDGWEGPLLRAAAVANALVREGVPADRLAVRFEAGLGEGSGEGRSVAVDLLCCAERATSHPAGAVADAIE